MTVEISTAHNEARLTGTRTFMDSGAANARIRIYDGTRPALGGAATTLLVEIVLAKPCGTVAANKLTLQADDPAGYEVVAAGSATWARIVNGNGDLVLDCDVSDPAGSGEVKLPGTTLAVGDIVPLSASYLD